MADQKWFVKGKQYEVKSPSGNWRTLVFVMDLGNFQLFRFLKRPSKLQRKNTRKTRKS